MTEEPDFCVTVTEWDDQAAFHQTVRALIRWFENRGIGPTKALPVMSWVMAEVVRQEREPMH